MTGKLRVGIGGWTFEPWRGAFYPQGHPHKRELEYASSRLTSIEVNGTYYSTFKPDTFAKWAGETPEDFVFSVKASRYCTNRKILATAGDSVAKFIGQGLVELGPKLGPINWQFMDTKRFQPDDFEEFLKLLPTDLAGFRLRHAVEPRHESFDDPAFFDMARRYDVAVVYGKGKGFPLLDHDSAGFRYARIMEAVEDEPNGYSDAELKGLATQAKGWAKTGDVFFYFISGAKVRDPAAAMAMIERLR